jgi:hypothetical protein
MWDIPFWPLRVVRPLQNVYGVSSVKSLSKIAHIAQENAWDEQLRKPTKIGGSIHDFGFSAGSASGELEQTRRLLVSFRQSCTLRFRSRHYNGKEHCGLTKVAPPILVRTRKVDEPLA